MSVQSNVTNAGFGIGNANSQRQAMANRLVLAWTFSALSPVPNGQSRFWPILAAGPSRQEILDVFRVDRWVAIETGGKILKRIICYQPLPASGRRKCNDGDSLSGHLRNSGRRIGRRQIIS